ncbi:MAG: GGDEF domain-containing protein [Deltaproteobacteria bacterium]|nr:GGDEF domain-containing protein [Deltaproteobacteria bacterium]MBN2674166.1 GGDEF domain-containing protein [Deltaproteobacteria bacterium]
MESFPKHISLPPRIERKAKISGALNAVFLVLFLAIVETLIYFILDARIHDEMDDSKNADMAHMVTRLEDLLSQQQNEFLFLANSELTRNCLINASDSACADIASLMKTMMKVNATIDHLRIIDHQGQEIVRVNRDKHMLPILVPGSKLQNKSQKSYFKESMKTTGATYYISRLDLNMENGKIETPRKPVLRFGKAVLSAKGHPLGVTVINFRTKPLLSRLNSAVSSPNDDWYLLNTQGYYLRGKSSNKEFTFMFPKSPQIGFFSDYPNAWSHFKTHGHQPYLSAEGKFYFSPIKLSYSTTAQAASGHWILVMHVPPEALAELNTLLRMGLSIGALLLSPILATLGWRNGRFQIKQKWYLHELAQNAITDNLTGLLNHRGVMEKLTPAVAVGNRRESPLVLVFIDVNDLKFLNDQMGHLMGDKLIKGAANALLDTVRHSDIVGRLGGDEFVVGLIDCDIPHVVRVMQRVEATLAQLGHETCGKAWTLSWGCTERLPNDTAEQMISRADKQMYAHKTEHKTGRHSIPAVRELRPN